MTLRVKLEIVPYGDEDEAYEIGRLDIFNKGRTETGHCEYGVIDLPADVDDGEPGLFDQTVLHRRDKGAWALVRKVLEELPVHGP
jgi:hypothetical protein